MPSKHDAKTPASHLILTTTLWVLLAPCYWYWRRLRLRKMKELAKQKELKSCRLGVGSLTGVKGELLSSTMLPQPWQRAHRTLKATGQISSLIYGVMKQAGGCHCKVFMETVMDISDFSFLIKYNCVCVVRGMFLSLSPPPHVPLFITHTHTPTLHPHLIEIPDKLE